MRAHAHVHLEGTVAVPLGRADAFELFTPSGERRWADGWDPSFPASWADETTPGTVFQTTRHLPVTWVVAACERPSSITYSTVSENDRAGLINVSCEPTDDGTTIAKVTYDMTALSDEGDARLHEFKAHYHQFLEHWKEAIESALPTSEKP